MSYLVYFSFSSGLSGAVVCPVGTLEAIVSHVAEVEKILSIKRTQYEDNPPHWDYFDDEFKRGFPSASDELLCSTAEGHNEWVRNLYRDLGVWQKNPPAQGETITPEDAARFWPGLQLIEVSQDRWTKEYYRARMESLYEAMRGRESEGIKMDGKPLTPAQAGAVVRLFSGFLDSNDLRLDVPHGRDYLASSYDGGYSWCDKCFRCIGEGDEPFCRRRKCPLQEEMA